MKRSQMRARSTWMRRSAGLKPSSGQKPSRAAARNTGPTREVRALVTGRDGGLCAGCGKAVAGIPFSLQHRVARGMGGTSRPEANSPERLVLLCGSATTPGSCHLACEQRDAEMNRRGLWLWSWQDPASVPVAYAAPEGLEWFLLLPDGYRLAVPAPEAGAA